MPIRKSDDLRNDCAKFKGFWPNRLQCKSYQCGAHLRGGRRAEGLTAAAAGEAAWFGGAKRAAEPGCERSERRILADARSVSARTSSAAPLLRVACSARLAIARNLHNLHILQTRRQRDLA